MKKIIPIFIVVFVVGCAGSFFAGLKVGQNQKGVLGKGFDPSNMPFPGNSSSQERMKQMQTRGMTDPRMMNRTGGAMVNGEVVSKDDKSMTVKTATGSSKIIFYSQSTKISRMADIKVDEVSVGQSVFASGSPSQDGSLMASSIQLVDSSQFQNQEKPAQSTEEKK